MVIVIRIEEEIIVTSEIIRRGIADMIRHIEKKVDIAPEGKMTITGNQDYLIKSNSKRTFLTTPNQLAQKAQRRINIILEVLKISFPVITHPHEEIKTQTIIFWRPLIGT